MQALHLMSQYLHQRHAQLTVVTVGGAVNCLLLQSRDSTHDVDIFGTNLDTHARVLLDEAMHYAIQHSRVPLGTDWFNTETQMWMSPDMQRELTESALHQHTVVFQEPGLTLLAAPWGYAFGAKIQRILVGPGEARPYDLHDAVTYLHQMTQRHQGQPVPLHGLEESARRYHQSSDSNYLMNTVNVEYERVYHRPGIIRSGVHSAASGQSTRRH